jgi:hypothetical protein
VLDLRFGCTYGDGGRGQRDRHRLSLVAPLLLHLDLGALGGPGSEAGGILVVAPGHGRGVPSSAGLWSRDPRTRRPSSSCLLCAGSSIPSLKTSVAASRDSRVHRRAFLALDFGKSNTNLFLFECVSLLCAAFRGRSGVY